MTVQPTETKALTLQYQDAEGDWIDFGACDAGSILRTRRLSSPPGRPVTARRWRLIRKAGGDLGAAKVQLGKLAFLREGDELSPFKRWSFDFDTGEQRYGLIATAGNVEIYRRGERVASVAIPHDENQVAAVRRAQSLDTLLAFHPSQPPHRIGRQGAHDEWDSRPVTFENVPLFDYEGTKLNGVDEKHQLGFVDFENGETFNLTLEGETTGAIAYSTTMATLAAAVETALRSLPVVGATGVIVTSPADKTLELAYGGKLAAEDVGEIVASVLSSVKGIVRTATLIQGKAGGEPVISASRGWPGAGLFYEGRLWLAAPRSRPQTLIASRPGFYYDLETEGRPEGKGIDVDLATDQSTRILGLFAGRHLQVFSQSAEFFCATSPITPPPAFPRTSNVGMQPNTPLLDLEGGTLFVQAGGDAVGRYVYDESVQSYVVETLSSYWSHLTQGVLAGGFRRHRSTSEPNLALWIRADGDAAAMTAVLAQDVLGFTGWDTNGAFVEAGGELAGDLYVGTRRAAGGVESHRLERLDEGRMLDASVLYETPGDEIDGLEHLEGREVVLYVDGADAGDAVVTDGRVSLPWPAQRSREAGLLFVPRGVTLPMVLTQDPRAGASMRARTGEIGLRLGPTANLRAGMAGKKMWPVALKRRGSALLDQGPGEDAFQGWTRVYPVPGFQDDAQVAFDQPRPGPLEIQELVCTVES